MPTRIDRLIIFGDSMSDIGNKRVTKMGKFARALGAMRTNAVGRFSDRKNWTDFLWEWAGGASMIDKDADHSNELTEHHRTLGKNSRWGTPAAAGFSYCNYAEGGAMGASDKFGIGLGTFKEQYHRYKEQRKKQLTAGNTLYIVWFGLNDLVTNGRNKEKMSPVAAEIRLICEKIQKLNPVGAHFLFANLPNPQGAVRFMDKEFGDEVCGLQYGAFEFNHALAREINVIQPNGRASLVDMYTPIEEINGNLDAYGLKKGAQPKGIKVKYSKMDSFDNNSFWTTTSDKAHPTETVYKYIAKIISTGILQHYDLGTLRTHPEATFVVR